MTPYVATSLSANIKVTLYRKFDEQGHNGVRREAEVIINDQFADDTELEDAVRALAASILEAARR